MCGPWIECRGTPKCGPKQGHRLNSVPIPCLDQKIPCSSKIIPCYASKNSLFGCVGNLQAIEFASRLGAEIAEGARNRRNSLLISLLAGNLRLETSPIEAASSAKSNVLNSLQKRLCSCAGIWRIWKKWIPLQTPERER